MGKRISIVITTLGGSALKKTILAINNNSIIPDEIILSLPLDKKNCCDDLLHIGHNVKIIYCPEMSQVSQRIYGFQEAIGDYVMQLDEDVLLDQDCIRNLLNGFKEKGIKSSFAPTLYTNDKFSYYQRPKNSILLKLWYLILNGSKGYQQGKVTKAGTNIGIDSFKDSCKYIEAEWAAGGCVLHQKENLILNNYFPFKGKAYCEDLIHTNILRNQGIKIYISTEARCKVLPPEKISSYKFSEFKRFISADLTARKYYVRKTKRSMLRMYIYYFVLCLRYFLERLLK